MGLFDFLFKPKKKSNIDYQIAQDIRRQAQVLSESIDIVNQSYDFDAVLGAFDSIDSSLRFLCSFSEEDIKAAGCSMSKSPAKTFEYIFENRETMIEQARERCQEKSPLYTFIISSYQATRVKGDAEKLRLLERLLPDFPLFIRLSFEQDSSLPPLVPCRDTLPELYMRFGKWDEAESVIRLCIAQKAYGYTEYDHLNNAHWFPESAEIELINLKLRRAASDVALAYLSENPGILQNKIYKVPELADVDHESLIWFCRNSHQIHKEKEGKTNRLFVAEEISV